MALEHDTDGTELVAELDDLARIHTCRQDLDLLLLDALTAGGLPVRELAEISRFTSTRMPEAALAWDRTREKISGKDA
ncbi:MAG: hypothetical protein L0H96_09590 [Humibacillus sp.]|nr:hypothetical protein [Humibacillus sp.]MDN5777151.1 hypothetical protein [Humibacillus sp.]